MSAESDAILLARDGPVATLTLNRPAALNSLDTAMLDALVAHTAMVAADATLRCVVIEGAGKHFMAGGDLKTFAELLAVPPGERKAAFTKLVGRLHTAIENLQRIEAPVVASVQGAVAGFGVSLMCACDLVVADESAYFTLAYRHIGLSSDGVATYSLARIVGVRKAMEIVLLGERFDAREALRLGLVNRVVPVAELEAATHAIVQALVTGPALALANGKRLVNQSLSATLSDQLQKEMESFGECAASADFAEGIAAFLARRPPRFGADPNRGP